MDSSTGQAMVTETSTETFTETVTVSASSMEETRAEDAAENPADTKAHAGRGNGTVLPERYDDRFPRAQQPPAEQPPAPEAQGPNPEMNEQPVAPAHIEAPAPADAPAAPPAAPSGETYFHNCAAARAAGAAPLHAGDPGYRSQLDGDNDGVACE
ncbi:excalibur calcium-binding domain-containing protein [Corynebacterium sp. MSK297]|uniref:excalibur calcium-binding domain-containing protein n=1 Tax=Corynebacterium sp. MSK297 TaxID=3050221 RepID=UPI00254D1E0F|nr:excalibur calcium-binding domain-containing protein [Corynebacterium sp. MSK297]MDK8846668.1 excalibur calcium-binding domain-containing protein [Corynebacterium sp. MSK297]